VFSLELLSVVHAGCAAVDASNLSLRPAQRMLGRLRCPAARDEDRLVFSIRSVGPKQVIVDAASLRVLPELLIPLQIIDRRRIRITVVEVPYFTCYIQKWREPLCIHANTVLKNSPADGYPPGNPSVNLLARLLSQREIFRSSLREFLIRCCACVLFRF
jgi:hypothetical protein